MALPPEPIEELLEQATDIVDAEVTAVLSTGETPPQKEAKPGMTSVGNKTASQVVKLKVNRALKGKLAGEITVEKPQAAYSLKPGNKGGFFLRPGSTQHTIIGRYGPDTYKVQSIEHVLKTAKK